MAYRYDPEFPDGRGWEPSLLPCSHCGYPEPRDAGPILVLDTSTEDVLWRNGFRLLACPHCELTSFGKLTGPAS